MRLVLLGGAAGVGKSAVARAVLTHHQGPPGAAPLLQWVDVDVVLVTWTFHAPELRRVVIDAATGPAWTASEQRYRAAQAEAETRTRSWTPVT